MKHEIEYLTASSSVTIDGLQSVIREVSIGNQVGLEVFCADNKWRVQIRTTTITVAMNWTDFVDIFDDFSKFVATESEMLIEDNQSESIE